MVLSAPCIHLFAVNSLDSYLLMLMLLNITQFSYYATGTCNLIAFDTVASNMETWSATTAVFKVDLVHPEGDKYGVGLLWFCDEVGNRMQSFCDNTKVTLVNQKKATYCCLFNIFCPLYTKKLTLNKTSQIWNRGLEIPPLIVTQALSSLAFIYKYNQNTVELSLLL